jgi:hypothetical protein
MRELSFLSFWAGLALGLILLGGMATMVWRSPGFDRNEASGWVLAWAAILLGGIWIVLGTIAWTAAFRSAWPDPAEQLLPRELHLFEDHVMVVPFDGAAFRTPWSAYVLGATAALGGMRLLLGRAPRLELFVRRGALTAHEWTLVRRWLAAQDLLGG